MLGLLCQGVNVPVLYTGAVVVVNSEKCLLWLENVLQSLWIPRGDTPTPYRGLPLVILALDDSIPDSKLPEKHTLIHSIYKNVAFDS